MKEKILDFLRIATYYPRKILDKLLYKFYFKSKNNWEVLEKHTNKDILIVGNGPSLNKTPLDKINSKIVSIGMNKINLLYKNSSWRPEIITCVNGLVLRQNKEFFNTTTTVLILPIKAYYLGIKPRGNILFVNLKDKEEFNPNIEQALSTGCTVTFTALQIAAYLKPLSVNIVGVDHSFVYDKGEDHEIKKFKGDDINHFSNDYFKGQYWGVPNLQGSEKLYKISKQYFEKKNIPILDYTIEGKLKIFEKRNIKELIFEKD